MTDTPYIGRFAPSPSGPLHFGSLVAALGSYLQARAHHGRWLLRIEDIDPPREMAHADTIILHQLASYGLHWDGEVLYQSRRQSAYHQVLDWLWQQGLSYACSCSRQRIQQLGGFYDRHCRQLRQPATQGALRLVQQHAIYQFQDKCYGLVNIPPSLAEEDFILRRRDGLFAYNLAVVVDDHFQGISEIVRGADLLQPSARQISLYQTFGWPLPEFFHLPLVSDATGQKLSKQNHAPALPESDPRPVLVRALAFLQQPAPQGWQDLSTEQLLQQAISQWQPEKRLCNRTDKIHHSQIYRPAL